MSIPTNEEIIAALEKQYGISLAGYQIQAMMTEVTTVFDGGDISRKVEQLDDEGMYLSTAVEEALEEYSRHYEIPKGFMGFELVRVDGTPHNPERKNQSGYFLILDRKHLGE